MNRSRSVSIEVKKKLLIPNEEGDFFTPEPNTKWSTFRVNMWQYITTRNEWENGDSCFYAHSHNEIRNMKDPIQVRIKKKVEIGEANRALNGIGCISVERRMYELITRERDHYRDALNYKKATILKRYYWEKTDTKYFKHIDIDKKLLKSSK